MKKIVVYLFLFVVIEYCYAMETARVWKPKKSKPDVQKQSESLMLQEALTTIEPTNANMVRCLVDTLKKQPKDSTWPLVLLKGNEKTKKVAAAIAQELQKELTVLTAHDVRNNLQIVLLKKKITALSGLIIIDQLFDFYSKFKESRARVNKPHVERELCTLLETIAKKNPLIILDKKPSLLPEPIRSLFYAPYMNIQRVIDVNSDDTSNKTQAVTDWCRQHAIDCVYSIAGVTFPTGFFEDRLPVETETREQDEMIKKIVANFKAYPTLSIFDWISVLRNIKVANARFSTIEFDDQFRQQMRLVRVVEIGNKTNNKIDVEYKAALDLNKLAELTQLYAKQKQIIETV